MPAWRAPRHFAVVGVGVVPRIALAGDAGLSLDNGVVVDERLVTSVPNIFAAGDVASAWHPFYERSIRVEHWANALNQGPAAARSMLGHDVSYERIPYFFSDQYDVVDVVLDEEAVVACGDHHAAGIGELERELEALVRNGARASRMS